MFIWYNMNKILFFALLWSVLGFSQVRYVTAMANGSGNGLTELTAWTPAQMINATAGMTVYIKAGLYKNYKLDFNIDGTKEKPIQFIGYKRQIGDIDAESQELLPDDTWDRRGCTKLAGGVDFDYKTIPSATEMPIFQKKYIKDETAFRIRGDHVYIKNLIIKDYSNAIFVLKDSNHAKIINCIFFEQGRQDLGVRDSAHPDRYKGEGTRIYGSNSEVRFCSYLNCEQQAASFLGSNSGIFSDNVMYSYNPLNGTDYFMLLSAEREVSTTNMTIEYNFFDRKLGTAHGGHGPVAKNGANNNTFRYFRVERCNIEANFSNVYENTWEYGTLLGDFYDSGDTSSYILVTNGAHHNTFNNLIVDNVWGVVVMHAYPDGASNDPLINSDSPGNNNVFKNIMGKNARYAMIFSEFCAESNVDALDNVMANCTFYNLEAVVRARRKNSGTKFYNNTFHTTTSNLVRQGNGYSLNTNTVFENNNFHGAVKVQQVAPYRAINNISVDPLFQNVNNLGIGDLKVDGLKLQPNSPLIGAGLNTFFAEGKRTSDFTAKSTSQEGLSSDIGAYEFRSIKND